jgi:hypothetical protein
MAPLGVQLGQMHTVGPWEPRGVVSTAHDPVKVAGRDSWQGPVRGWAHLSELQLPVPRPWVTVW